MTPLLIPAVRPQGLEKIFDLLRTLTQLAALRDALTTPDGLRRAIELALRVAGIVGLPPEFIQRLRTILDNPQAFAAVLAVVEYLAGLMKIEGELPDGRLHLKAVDGQREAAVAARDFFDWLPFVIQLLDLLRQVFERR
jgi:hypothetical protein